MCLPGHDCWVVEVTSPLPLALVKIPAGYRFDERNEQLLAPTDDGPLNWAAIQQLVLGVAALAIFVAIGIYLAGKIRAKAVQKEPPASELLTKFREMHSRGVLSDEEFRTIKTTLTERLQTELRDKDETG